MFAAKEETYKYTVFSWYLQKTYKTVTKSNLRSM